MMKRTSAILLAAGMAASVLAGCSGNTDKNESSASISQTQASKNLVLGVKNSSSKKVTLTNKTGLTIDSLTLQPEGENQPGKNLIPQGESWKAGSRADLYLTEEEQLAGNLVLTIGAKEGDQQRSYSLYNVPTSSLANMAELNLQQDQLSLSWLQDGKVVSTSSNDTSAISSQESTEPSQDVQEDQTIEDQPSEPVYIEPVYEEPAYQEPVYEEPVYEEPVDEDVYGGEEAIEDDYYYYDQTGEGEYSADEVVLNSER